ncbi:reverse transcriptase [Cucumis melo var. makuwa]|uniref:Reverse transcriptase n=1 Tax=Cucumis melo var. makuwa TaxID=1194695 RepID=A0A5A7TGD5_CUCMM|nr:reverse transcriptase [Cucumis melo var. makuwa]TYK17850.1 reverse transcriptase [Cucumis melo var. makuwa]
MPFCVLHFQTPLDCLKESYPSTRLILDIPLQVFECPTYVHSHGPNQTKFTLRAQACVFVGYLLHQRGYKCFHPSSRKYFESTCPTMVTLPDPSPHSTVLPTNQDSEPTRDQGMTGSINSHSNNRMRENDRSEMNSTNSHTDNKAGENDGSEITVPEDMGEQDSIDSVIIDRDDSIDENEGQKLVGCKWVFTLKYKADETLDRHKARDLVEEVYMSPPPSFEAQFGQQVCKLQKSLYGLKQSPRVWFGRFTIFVKSQGDSQEHSDHTLFTEIFKTRNIVVLIVYVDDIVFSGDDQIEINQLKQRMGILGCRPADTSIEFNCKPGDSDDQVPVDREQYQRLVGKLIYLSHTRRDISFDECETPLKFFYDNKAAISIVNNPVQHDKHVEIDPHFIKERLESRNICIPYIPSS